MDSSGSRTQRAGEILAPPWPVASVPMSAPPVPVGTPMPMSTPVPVSAPVHVLAPPPAAAAPVSAAPAGVSPASSAQHLPSADASTPPGACDLVTVPTRQGLEAVDILRRGAPAIGPVLHDDSRDTLGFVVPAGTADAWDLPGSACTQTAGRGLPLAAAAGADQGADWLLPPTDESPVTDPAALREALGEAARMIAAADGCR